MLFSANITAQQQMLSRSILHVQPSSTKRNWQICLSSIRGFMELRYLYLFVIKISVSYIYHSCCIQLHIDGHGHGHENQVEKKEEDFFGQHEAFPDTNPNSNGVLSFKAPVWDHYFHYDTYIHIKLNLFVRCLNLSK